MTAFSARTKILGALLLLAWILLAIEPHHRADWLLENLLVLIGVPLIVRFGPGLRFSDATYASLSVFFVMHLIGAHYTYSEVPYREWFGLDHGRNHYDRLVHFAYGLLMALPAIELLEARAKPAGFWRWLLPILFLVSHGVIYELLEWAAAEVFGGDLGVAFLGTQGDEWDAQKDMGLAALGAVIGVFVWRGVGR